MRFGLAILTDQPWAEASSRWRAAEEMGFDHAWTYDHIVWGGLPDSPWFGAVPTLAVAAAATSTIRLGTLVAAPNFRHPVAFHREVQALDDISAGRLLLGVGTGGDLDSRILGGPELNVKDRVDRFQEFVGLLVRLRTEDHVTSEGRWFSAYDARTLPPLRDAPLILAANGPRSLRYAARAGDGWVTTGGPAETVDEWWAGLSRARTTMDEALSDADREPGSFPRYLLLDSAPQYGVARFSLQSAGLFEEMVGRAAGLGFTDVITHWPRVEEPYAGTVDVLEAVAADVLPRLRSLDGN
ncbi:MAG: LLM class flavin-dependent oxidoreductase [Actinomycetota bacterium]|nr:LLM class flavin-dependent oxidoreductase [Actinomycetota bacterium]